MAYHHWENGQCVLWQRETTGCTASAQSELKEVVQLRVMAKISIPVTAFNGVRTAFMVFDMPDSSALPVFTEPLFMEFNADVEIAPVMNGDDLQAGLASLA
jgi:hypothetical protein